VENAILRMPDQGTAAERRRVLRAAIRHLDRAELYIAGAAFMDLGDPVAQRALGKLRSDVESLRHHLTNARAAISD